MQKKTKKTLMIIIGIICASLGSLFAVHVVANKFNFFINNTPSMALGIYKMTGSPVEHGSIIAFCPPPSAVTYSHKWHPEEKDDPVRCPTGGVMYVKYAMGLPGDNVTLTKEGVRINNGSVLLGSQPLERVGYNKSIHLMPDLIGKTWHLKKNQFWAYTPQWYSFDSRYYGPIDHIETAREIFVYKESPQSTMPPSVRKIQVYRS